MQHDNIIEYSNEIKAEIANGKLIDGKYCIIVTTFKGGGITKSSTSIRNVYKNIDDFEKKAPEHMRGIDSMFGIDVLTYIFD